MRILFLTRCFFPAVEYGGPIFVMNELLQRLVARGHQVTVWTTDLLNLKEKMPNSPFEDEVLGGKVVYLRTGPGYRWDRIAPGLDRHCRTNLHGFDVIHIFGYRDFLSPWVCHYASRRGIPYVLEPLGSFLPHLRSFRKKWAYDRTLGKVIVSHAARLIASSDMERSDILSLGVSEDRVDVRLNGIDVSAFEALPERGALRDRLKIERTSVVILFLGRINPKKGLERLFAALPSLPPAVHLIVAGPAEEESYLDQLTKRVADLGLAARVHFAGPVYGHDKLQALADADLFVLASDRENYGISVAEAVASGLPVIVTNTCGVASYLPDQAGVVIPLDTAALTDALKALASDSRARKRMADACRAARWSFSWDEPVRVQERIYESVMPSVSRQEAFAA